MVLNSGPSEICSLGSLNPGDQAEIVALNAEHSPEDYFRRLLEIGFLVGERLEVLNEAPVSKNPVCIKIKDATYALRREEADCISVKRLR
ncbi:MAG: ferrous iron transport protein A [Bdellovibrionales bacterium]|nr:ferrous iron transport protein A [Bdellovibrionales bacterium]